MRTYSIIICTYNRAKLLRETIISLLTFLKDKPNYEIIVIDNNSSDDTQVVCTQFPVLRYILELNQGLSHARNRGILEAENDILLFLDDDIEVANNFFSVFESIFKDDNLYIAGGKVLPFNTSIPNWLPKQYYYLVSIFDLGDASKSVTKLMGANYAMRKEVAEKVGSYDINLGRKGNVLTGGEEIDYLNRAKSEGFDILYHPDLVVYHKISEKLDLNYILNYSFNLGKSESIMISKINPSKHILKKLKAYFTIQASKYFLDVKFSESTVTYIKLNYQYSLGYLGLHNHKS